MVPFTSNVYEGEELLMPMFEVRLSMKMAFSFPFIPIRNDPELLIKLAVFVSPLEFKYNSQRLSVSLLFSNTRTDFAFVPEDLFLIIIPFIPLMSFVISNLNGDVGASFPIPILEILIKFLFVSIIDVEPSLYEPPVIVVPVIEFSALISVKDLNELPDKSPLISIALFWVLKVINGYDNWYLIITTPRPPSPPVVPPASPPSPYPVFLAGVVVELPTHAPFPPSPNLK